MFSLRLLVQDRFKSTVLNLQTEFVTEKINTNYFFVIHRYFCLQIQYGLSTRMSGSSVLHLEKTERMFMSQIRILPPRSFGHVTT